MAVHGETAMTQHRTNAEDGCPRRNYPFLARCVFMCAAVIVMIVLPQGLADFAPSFCRLNVLEDEELKVACESTVPGTVRAYMAPSNQTHNANSAEFQLIGTCDTRGNCQNYSSDMWLKFATPNVSIITSGQVDRNTSAGTYKCLVLPDTAFIMKSKTSFYGMCLLDVIYPLDPALQQCTVNIDTSDWTIIGSCDISKVYSALDNYTCEWFVYEDDEDLTNSDSMYPTPLYGTIDQPHKLPKSTTRLALRPFKDSRTRRVYLSGMCGFRWNFPTTVVTRTTFKYFAVFSPNIPLQTVGLVMEPPTPPRVDCPTSIRRGGVIRCTCKAENIGTPPGRLVWKLGSRVLERGDTNQTTLELIGHTNGSESRNFLEYHCEVAWAKNVSTHVKVDIEVKVPTQIIKLTINGRERKLIVPEHQSVKITCVVIGSPVPTIQLFKGAANDTSVESLSSVPVFTGGMLVVERVIEKVPCGPPVRYTCTATGKNEEEESAYVLLGATCTARLRISDDAVPMLLFGPDDVNQLHLHIDAFPPPEHPPRILFHGHEERELCCSKLVASCTSVETGGSRLTCVITAKNISGEDLGKYVLRIVNAAGFGEVPFILGNKASAPVAALLLDPAAGYSETLSHCPWAVFLPVVLVAAILASVLITKQAELLRTDERTVTFGTSGTATGNENRGQKDSRPSPGSTKPMPEQSTDKSYKNRVETGAKSEKEIKPLAAPSNTLEHTYENGKDIGRGYVYENTAGSKSPDNQNVNLPVDGLAAKSPPPYEQLGLTSSEANEVGKRIPSTVVSDRKSIDNVDYSQRSGLSASKPYQACEGMNEVTASKTDTPKVTSVISSGKKPDTSNGSKYSKKTNTCVAKADTTNEKAKGPADHIVKSDSTSDTSHLKTNDEEEFVVVDLSSPVVSTAACLGAPSSGWPDGPNREDRKERNGGEAMIKMSTKSYVKPAVITPTESWQMYDASQYGESFHQSDSRCYGDATRRSIGAREVRRSQRSCYTASCLPFANYVTESPDHTEARPENKLMFDTARVASLQRMDNRSQEYCAEESSIHGRLHVSQSSPRLKSRAEAMLTKTETVLGSPRSVLSSPSPSPSPSPNRFNPFVVTDYSKAEQDLTLAAGGTDVRGVAVAGVGSMTFCAPGDYNRDEQKADTDYEAVEMYSERSYKSSRRFKTTSHYHGRNITCALCSPPNPLQFDINKNAPSNVSLSITDSVDSEHTERKECSENQIPKIQTQSPKSTKGNSDLQELIFAPRDTDTDCEITKSSSTQPRYKRAAPKPPNKPSSTATRNLQPKLYASVNKPPHSNPNRSRSPSEERSPDIYDRVSPPSATGLQKKATPKANWETTNKKDLKLLDAMLQQTRYKESASKPPADGYIAAASPVPAKAKIPPKKPSRRLMSIFSRK